MTDRLKGFTVVLEQDLRDDDAEPLKAAIAQMRGVLEVRPVLTSNEDHWARIRVRNELKSLLYRVLEEK
jgi:hypothetical protein